MSVVAYHFWSPTCGPCKVIKPAVEDLKEEFGQVRWITVNTHDDADGLAQKLGVKLVPTIVVIAYSDAGSQIYTEKHSGSAMVHYYRILRNALRSISSL
jgi:thiol-disulfide isomerase/thioredoxin